MRSTTDTMAGRMANAMTSRAVARRTCPSPWYGTGIEGAHVAVFTDHKLPPVRPKESP